MADESTPPDSPQTTRPFAPTVSRTSVIASSMKEATDQSPFSPQAPNRKLRRISSPLSVWSTSGWNCTPKNFREGSSTAVNGAFSLSAVREKPGAQVLQGGTGYRDQVGLDRRFRGHRHLFSFYLSPLGSGQRFWRHAHLAVSRRDGQAGQAVALRQLLGTQEFTLGRYRF